MSGVVTRSLTQNPLIDAIAGITIWASTVLNYAFVKDLEGDRVSRAIPATSSGSFQPLESNAYFRDTVLAAFSAYEQVANLRFEPTLDIAEASIKVAGLANYVTSIGLTAGTADLPGNNPSDDRAGEFESFLLLNTTLSTALIPAEPGGANSLLSTTLHELGHVLGLTHPHDSISGTRAITGLSLDDPNDRPIDNRRYTVLSFEDGGFDVLFGRGFGHSASPGALDIAALQAIYGANTSTNQSDTRYILTDPQVAHLDVNGNDGEVQIGRAFFSIWDTGGTDELSYNGTDNVVLNLNDATLVQSDDADTLAWIHEAQSSKNYALLPQEFRDDIENPAYHAGGFFSRIFRDSSPHGYDLGGYSIANGVVIENASASSGEDFLIGNEFANILDGGAGKDFLHGSAGNDILRGGAGDDEIFGGSGNDWIEGGSGEDFIHLGDGADTIEGNLEDLKNDYLEDFDIGDQILVRGATISQISSRTQARENFISLKAGQLQADLTVAGDWTAKTWVADVDPEDSNNTIVTLVDHSRNVLERYHPIIGSYDVDVISGTPDDDFVVGGNSDDTLLGNGGDDQLVGSPGNDWLVGGSGNDRLLGGYGMDSLVGGDGRDKFVFRNPAQGVDHILDFEVGHDSLVFKHSMFQAGLGVEELGPERFVIGSAAATRQNRFIYNDQNGSLFYDPDGTDMQVQKLIAKLDPQLPLTHRDFHLL